MMNPQCPLCSRYRGGLKCEAFPERIPEAILTGVHDHTQPLGEEKLLFEPREGVQKSFYDYTQPIAEVEKVAYERAKKAAVARGYKDSDFDEDGPLYGWSTNEILELLGGAP